MKRTFVLAILIIFLFSGCSSSHLLENQALAVSMGVDYTGGVFNITVQVPSISAPNDAQEKGGSGGYLIYSASDVDFIKAYHMLEASLPMELNLSLIKSIVFSEEFSKSDAFSDTLSLLVHMFSLSLNASVIVTRSEANEFLKNQKPFIGKRLSVTIPNMIEYRTNGGYIVNTSLSSLYAGLESEYSTAKCALADTASPTPSGELMAGEIAREGENKNEYMGCALFDREKLVLLLNGWETQLMHFICGTGGHTANISDPSPVRLTARKPRDIEITPLDGRIRIHLDMYLDVTPLIAFPDMDKLSAYIKSETEKLIEKCQTHHIEPFGFSDIAARRFLTNDEWMNYDWLQKFSEAEILISVSLIGEK
ncbi:MAG: hypothetical protein IJC48_10355 [Clostridia bacterium]|nr:hypothetical protein [Clostridia bacterium]MBQ4157445.1 hypothetical protein [Clostridia bacterium]